MTCHRVLQMLGRRPNSEIEEHVDECGECKLIVQTHFVDYQQNGGSPEITDRKIAALEVFLSAWNSARTIRVFSKDQPDRVAS